MDFATGLVIIGVSIAIYFIPTIIASGRSHPNAVAIFILNIFAGWTGICWIVALVWSFTSPAKPVEVRAPAYTPPAPVEPSHDPVAVKIGQLERLAKLKADGALTEHEYEQEKRLLIG